jgi:hypothetical protein
MSHRSTQAHSPDEENAADIHSRKDSVLNVRAFSNVPLSSIDERENKVKGNDY